MKIVKIKRMFSVWIIIFLIFYSLSSFAYGFNIETECGKLKSEINKENCALINNNVTIFIKGGFGFSFEICNYGDTTLYLVNWSITIDGPLVFLGKDFGGTISEIQPGECVNIGSILLFGIGQIDITVQIDDIIESASGYLIGPFVFLI